MSLTELKSADSLADLVRLAADVSARLQRKTPKVAITPTSWPGGKVISVERWGSKILVSNRAIECLSREELAFAMALQIAPSDRARRLVAMRRAVAYLLFGATGVLLAPSGPVNLWRLSLFLGIQYGIGMGVVFTAIRIGKKLRADALLGALNTCLDIGAARAFIRKRATDRLGVDEAGPRLRGRLEEQIDKEIRDFDKTVGELGLSAEYPSEQ